MYVSKRSLIAVLAFGVLFCVTQIAIARTDPTLTTTQEQAKTGDGSGVPSGSIYGIIEFKTTTETNLLNLRGIAGRGEMVLQSVDENECIAFPVRLVAGDFDGNEISTRTSGPIRMVLLSRQITAALRDGQDVVSDMYRVSNDRLDTDADILILEGLSADSGFVLNPGRSLFADLFGARGKTTPCVDDLQRR